MCGEAGDGSGRTAHEVVFASGSVEQETDDDGIVAFEMDLRRAEFWAAVYGYRELIFGERRERLHVLVQDQRGDLDEVGVDVQGVHRGAGGRWAVLLGVDLGGEAGEDRPCGPLQREQSNGASVWAADGVWGSHLGSMSEAGNCVSA